MAGVEPSQMYGMRSRQEQEVVDWAERVNADPSNPLNRARLAAVMIRAGYYREASEQLDICLALCPPNSRKRLLVVVLRARLQNASRRRSMWD